MKRRFSLLSVLILACALLIGCNNSSESSVPPSSTAASSAAASTPAESGDQKVYILSANYEDQIALQLEYLRELFPDAKDNIHIEYMSSGKLAAKLTAEGADTEVDIALSLSSGYANTLKKEGLLRAYEAETKFQDQYADADDVVLPNGVWCGAIIINTEELAKANLPEPTSYQDLLDPIYKDKIVMCDPNSSSTGYFYVLGLLNLYGEEAGWQFFDDLHASGNIQQWATSGSTPTKMIEMGEIPIAIGMDYEGMRLEREGKPVKVIFPEEGVPYDYDTTLLIKRNEEPSEFVLQVMEAITSVEGNKVFNNYNISVLEGDANRFEYPESFKLLDMKGIDDADLKTTLTTEWSNRYE